MNLESQIISIKNFNDKDIIIDRIFLIKDKFVGTGKNGKAFITVLSSTGFYYSDCLLNASESNRPGYFHEIQKYNSLLQQTCAVDPLCSILENHFSVKIRIV